MDNVRAFVQSVARRLGVQRLLHAGGVWLSAGFGAAAALLLAERVASLGANVGLLVAVPVLASCLAALAAGLGRWPGWQDAALNADAHLRLDERLSSALAAAEGPMADLVRSDAERRIAAVSVRREFPVRVPGEARWLVLCAVALLMAALMPPLDLLGWGAARAARAAERAAVRQATEAAGVGLGKLAAAGQQQGLERAKETLGQIGRELEGLAASEPTAEQARDASRKAVDDVNKARTANDRALEKAAEPKERAKEETERDLLLSALRLLEGWQRELAGGALAGARPAPAKGDGKGKEAEPRPAPDFVRAQEAPPVPRETIKVESRLLATRPAAEAATRREDVPWQYRALVRRYFSPGQDEPRKSE